jgi:hypothetical protein
MRWCRPILGFLLLLVPVFGAVTTASPAEAGFAPSGGTSFAWGEWSFREGRWIRGLAPTGERRLVGVSWFVGLDGSFYTAPVVPDPKLRPTVPPDWYPLPRKGGAGPLPPELRRFSLGDWTRIGCRELRRVNPPGPSSRGSNLYVDPEGNFWRCAASPKAIPLRADTPVWFPGIPEGWKLAPGAEGLTRD